MSQQQRGGQGFALDYIDVAERIVEFRVKHPEGSLQPADPTVPYRVETIGDQTYIVVVAAAYRTPDDPKPGIGMAYEVFPGRTPYTRGSELQNAETSAWGRAIVAALAGDTKRGVASAEEVRNRRAEQEAPPQQIPPQGRNGKAMSEAAQAVAKLAESCNDADKLVATFNEAKAKNLLTIDVRDTVHADLLDAVGVEPGKPVPLGAWLTAAGKFVRANGGMSVADHVRRSIEAVPA